MSSGYTLKWDIVTRATPTQGQLPQPSSFAPHEPSFDRSRFTSDAVLPKTADPSSSSSSSSRARIPLRTMTHLANETVPSAGNTVYPSVLDAEQEPLLEARASEEPVDEERVRQEHRLGDFTFSIVVYAGLLLFLITTWYLVLAHNPVGLSWFAFHPPLNSLAIALLTLGILTLQPTSTPTSKAAGLTRHQLFQLTAFTLLTAGVFFIILNKSLHHAAHFTTWHSIFGITAYIWLFLHGLIGGLSVWFGGKAFGGEAKAKRVWKYHRVSGYLLFPFLLVTVHLAGAYSDWTNMVSGPVLRAFGYAVAPALILAGVLGRARLSKMKMF